VRPPMLAIALIAIACRAAPPVPGSKAASDSLLFARLPADLSGFRATAHETWEDPRFGVMVGYQGPDSLRVPVYLYPITPASFGRTPSGRDSALRFEYNASRDDIFTLAGLGSALSASVLRETALRLLIGPTRTVDGRLGSFAYVFNAVPVYSHLYVFVIDSSFLKIRCFYPQASGPPDPPEALRSFVGRLVQHIGAGGHSPGR